MSIIYPYRDAIEGIQEILADNKEGTPTLKRQLADACRDYLEWVGDEEDEDEEDEDENE